MLYTAYLVFFISGSYLLSSSKDLSRRFIDTLLLVALPFAVYSILSFLPLPEFIHRFFSYGNDDIRGMLLALAAPLAFSRRNKLIFTSGFIFLAGAAFSSTSGALAASTGTLLVIVFLLRHRQTFRAAVIAGFILLVTAAVWLSPFQPFSQIAGEFSGAFSASSTLHERFIIWDASLKMTAHRPLLGWGPGVMTYTFSRFEPEALLEFEPSTSITDRAHNELIQLSLDGGMIYFLAVIGIILFVLFKARIREIEDAGALSSLAAYAAASLAVFASPQVTPFAALLAGSLLPTGSRKNKRASVSPVNAFLAVFMVFLAAAAAIGHISYGYASLMQKRGEFARAESAAGVSTAVLFWLPEPAVLKGSIQSDIAFQTNSPDYFSRAEQSFMRAIRRLPLERSGYLAAGRFYFLTDRLDKAEEMYRKAIELSPVLDIPYLMLAKVYLKRNDAETAAGFARKALHLNESAENHRVLGMALFLLNNQEEALKHLTEATRLEPGYITFKTLAAAFLKLDDTEMAIYYFQRALDYAFDPELAQVVDKLQSGKPVSVSFDI